MAEESKCIIHHITTPENIGRIGFNDSETKSCTTKLNSLHILFIAVDRIKFGF